MITNVQLEYTLLQELTGDHLPETYLKIVGKGNDLSEFHHDIWYLPFYQRLVEKSKNRNTTTYLYLSDKNVSSSNLFFIYEISISKFSLKGTHSIKKRILNIKDNLEDYRAALKHLIIDFPIENAPPAIWNYITLL